MAFVCENCSRGSDYGHNVSHAKNRTRRVRKPNLHKIRVIEDGEIVKKLLCVRCIRAAKRPVRSVEEKVAEKKSE